MRKKVIIILVFFMFLYIAPVNLSPSYAPATILTEQKILSDLPVGETALTEYGYKTYLGNGSWNYITQMGTRNTWNGEEWVRWIYDFPAKSITIRDVTFTHKQGGALSISGTSGIKIGNLQWYAQYYQSNQWHNVTLDNYEWLGFQVNETHGIARQRFYGSQGELLVSLIYSNIQDLKVTVEVTNNAPVALPVRLIWAASDIMYTIGNYELIQQELFGSLMVVGVNIDGFKLQWLDALNYDPTIAVNTYLDRPNRFAAVIFGNQSSVLPSGYTYTLDPSVNPVLGADIDDDWWRYDTMAHYTTSTELYLYWDGTLNYTGQVRFALDIPPNATIDSATFTAYRTQNGVSRECPIYRIDETNVGSLEGDVSAPAIDMDYAYTFSFDAGGASWSDAEDIQGIIQDQVNLVDWESGYYVGLNIRCLTNPSGTIRLDDYQSGSGNYAYLNITYTPEAVPTTTTPVIVTEINYFEEFFLSTDVWGWLGPFILVAFIFVVAQKEKALAIIGLIVDALFCYTYFTLFVSEPLYMWHAIITLLGLILICIPLLTKR